LPTVVVAALFGLSACTDLSPRSSSLRAPLTFATFSGIVESVQGGRISRVVYAEVPGDASLSSVSVNGDELLVKGVFTAEAKSKWAGVGFSVGAPSSAFDAGGFRALRIRLGAAPGVDKLRIRLKGNNKRVGASGCHPAAVQVVTPQLTEYEIEFSQFASDRSCGDQVVPVAVAVNRLAAIEVVDAANPVRERAVEFTVGSIILVR
jgi:hypothetical protein